MINIIVVFCLVIRLIFHICLDLAIIECSIFILVATLPFPFLGIGSYIDIVIVQSMYFLDIRESKVLCIINFIYTSIFTNSILIIIYTFILKFMHFQNYF